MEALSAHPTLNLAALANTHRAWDRPAGSPPMQTRLDAAQIAAQLTQQTGLHVPPLKLQDSTLRLKDSKVFRIDHIPVAMRQYEWNGIPVSLAQADGSRLDMPYSLQELRHHGRCFLIHQNEGLTYIFWCEGKDNFVLVARMPPARLFTLTYKICANLRPG